MILSFKKTTLLISTFSVFTLLSLPIYTQTLESTLSTPSSGSSVISPQNNSSMTGSNVNDNNQFIGPVVPAPSTGLLNGGIAGFAPTSGFNSGLSSSFNIQPQTGGCPSWGMDFFSYNMSYGFHNGWAVLMGGNLLNISGQFGPNSINRNNAMNYGVQYTTNTNFQYGLNLNITRWLKQNDNGQFNSLNMNYDLQPYMQKVFGQNCIYITGDYVQVYSPQPYNNSTYGSYWDINPQYSFLADKYVTYSSQATLRIVTPTYYQISNQTGNTQSDIIQVQPLNVNYNPPELSNVNLSLSWNISWNNFRGPQISGTGYNTSWNVNPSISYNGVINSTVGYWIKDSITFANNITPWRYVTNQTSAGNYNETQITNCITFGFNQTFNAFTLSNSSQPSNIQTTCQAGAYNSNNTLGINDLQLIQNFLSLFI